MKTKDKNPLALKLEKLRGKRTQQEMAEALDVGLDTYRSWEQGNRLPGLKMVSKLAKALGVSMDQLAV